MSRSCARRFLPLLVIFLGILVQTQASFARSEPSSLIEQA